MKFLFFVLVFLPALAMARIEDNSFLLEEAFNQEWGVYQFIQEYQMSPRSRTYEYSFENEIPISDKVHQFSYEIPFARAEDFNHGGVGDIVLNYRVQPLNRDGILVADRFGLILPTGNVKNGAGNGVYGLEFMQAATITMSERWMNHWNFGFNVLPNAKSAAHNKRGTMTGATAGSSLIYLMRDDFNILFEAVLQSGQSINPDGSKSSQTSLTLNPGFRWAWDTDWKETQIVPGISFPTEVLSDRTEQGVLFYLSIEPKFY